MLGNRTHSAYPEREANDDSTLSTIGGDTVCDGTFALVDDFQDALNGL